MKRKGSTWESCQGKHWMHMQSYHPFDNEVDNTYIMESVLLLSYLITEK